MLVTMCLWVCYLLLILGLLCIALSQPAHCAHPQWSVRIQSLGLKESRQRRTAGALALLMSAMGMVSLEGLGMGLALWVMSSSFNALVVAWVLSHRGRSTPQRD